MAVNLSCSAPPGIANGFFVFPEIEYAANTTIHYYCKQGYERSVEFVNASLECDGSTGQWSGSAPTCTLTTTDASATTAKATDPTGWINQSVVICCFVAGVIITIMLMYICCIFSKICRKIESNDVYGEKTEIGCWYFCCSKICMCCCPCLEVEDTFDEDFYDVESIASDDSHISEISIISAGFNSKNRPIGFLTPRAVTAQRNWGKLRAVKRVMGLRKYKRAVTPTKAPELAEDSAYSTEENNSEQSKDQELGDGRNSKMSNGSLPAFTDQRPLSRHYPFTQMADAALAPASTALPEVQVSENAVVTPKTDDEVTKTDEDEISDDKNEEATMVQVTEL